MKFDKDTLGVWSLVLTDDAFITFKNDWKQLRPGYNWRSFHLIHAMFEQDSFAPGWVVEVILLGFGFRLRVNGDWSKTESGRKLLKAEEEVENGTAKLVPFEELDDELKEENA